MADRKPGDIFVNGDSNEDGALERANEDENCSSDDSVVPRKRRLFAQRGGDGSDEGSCSSSSSDSPLEDPEPNPVKKKKRVKLLSQSSRESSGEEAGGGMYSKISGKSNGKKGRGAATTRKAANKCQLNAEQRNSMMDYLSSACPALSQDVVKRLLVAHNWELSKAVEAATKYEEAADAYDVDVVDSDLPDELSETRPKKAKAPKPKRNKDGSLRFKEEFLDSDEISDDELEIPDALRPTILSFFNEALPEELATVPGCSLKRSSYIQSLRPFNDWPDLLTKFTAGTLLSTTLLEGGVDLIYTRQSVIQLMKKCEDISQEMETKVSQLLNADMDETSSTIEIVDQPSILTEEMQLKPYQMVGLNWLLLMYKQEVDGILADEMGLGKTAQTIAFLAHLWQTKQIRPHIIVVPTSTIDNWFREILMWCPEFKVMKYYGSMAERVNLRRRLFRPSASYHIILTTYNIITSSADDRMIYKRISFEYAVFDEGHMLKNMCSQRYQNLMKISSRRRLLLTGTPLQNNLVELMSLLCFVMPGMFVGNETQLRKIFTSLPAVKTEDRTRGVYERSRIDHAKKIMKPFILRRLKKDVLTQLPQKTEVLEHVPLSAKQHAIYHAVRHKVKVAWAEDRLAAEQLVNDSKEGVLDEGESLRKEAEAAIAQRVVKGKSVKTGKGAQQADGNKNSVVGLLFDLRKVANHHLLLRHLYDLPTLRKMAKLLVQSPSHQDANEQYVYEDMCVLSDFTLNNLCMEHPVLRPFSIGPIRENLSGKFEYFDRVLPAMKAAGDRVLIFSQFTTMMDIIEVYLQDAGHLYMRLDGSTKTPERQELVDTFNADPTFFIFILSTKAGGLGINLTAANTVIIHDIDYNPYNDKQAEDRCHRVGQTREVRVIRLISQDTVEEAMLSIANEKLKLEKDIHTEEETSGGSKNMASLLKQALS